MATEKVELGFAYNQDNIQHMADVDMDKFVNDITRQFFGSFSDKDFENINKTLGDRNGKINGHQVSTGGIKNIIEVILKLVLRIIGTVFEIIADLFKNVVDALIETLIQPIFIAAASAYAGILDAYHSTNASIAQVLSIIDTAKIIQKVKDMIDKIQKVVNMDFMEELYKKLNIKVPLPEIELFGIKLPEIKVPEIENNPFLKDIFDFSNIMNEVVIKIDLVTYLVNPEEAIKQSLNPLVQKNIIQKIPSIKVINTYPNIPQINSRIMNLDVLKFIQDPQNTLQDSATKELKKLNLDLKMLPRIEISSINCIWLNFDISKFLINPNQYLGGILQNVPQIPTPESLTAKLGMDDFMNYLKNINDNLSTKQDIFFNKISTLSIENKKTLFYKNGKDNGLSFFKAYDIDPNKLTKNIKLTPLAEQLWWQISNDKSFVKKDQLHNQTTASLNTEKFVTKIYNLFDTILPLIKYDNNKNPIPSYLLQTYQGTVRNENGQWVTLRGWDYFKYEKSIEHVLILLSDYGYLFNPLTQNVNISDDKRYILRDFQLTFFKNLSEHVDMKNYAVFFNDIDAFADRLNQLNILSFPKVDTKIDKIVGKATELGKDIRDKIPAKLSYLLGIVDTIKNALSIPFNYIVDLIQSILDIIKKIIQFDIPGAFADAKEFFQDKLIPKVDNIQKMILDFIEPLLSAMIGKYEGGKEILQNLMDKGLDFYNQMFNIGDSKLSNVFNSTNQIYDQISKEGIIDPIKMKDSYLAKNGQQFYMTAATFATDMSETYKDLNIASKFEGGMSKYATAKSMVGFIKNIIDLIKRVIPAIIMECINICLKYFLTNDINKYFTENVTKLIDKLGFGILGVPFAGSTITQILNGFGIEIPKIDVSFLVEPKTNY